ncbi:hypothetical protein QN391_16280 [Pseudomonas sp. CCI1.2]|uniref:hypothetical protein n=1 Tax=Pseudomonas sp. CCI1.2 TaxID=3048614 RepID=UPI002B22B899|nr:hypothetical protein [Pseudomonas sp. CCI1.2]MEB0122243.1 hypothetical protein [Pseudomonas sp. CCI1.2]
MGRQRTINDKKFWNSPKMAGRTQEDRATLVYLLTCTSSNIAGSYSIVPRIAAAEMGWDTESQFMPVLKRLCDSGFIKYDAETSFVWVRIWWEHNSPKMALAPTLRQKSIKQIREMPAHWISDYLDDMVERLQDSDEYREMLIHEFQASGQSGDKEGSPTFDAIDGVSIPHRQPMGRPADGYNSQINGENTTAANHPATEGSLQGKPEEHRYENRVPIPYLSHIPRGAGNYNPNNNYKNNTTTTDRSPSQSGNILIFPRNLSQTEQTSIAEALLQISDTDAQKLLDELAAAISSKKVKTTVTQLFHGLLKIHHQGKLQPSSGAMAIAAKRSQNGGVGQEAIATLKRKMLIN